MEPHARNVEEALARSKELVHEMDDLLGQYRELLADIDAYCAELRRLRAEVAESETASDQRAAPAGQATVAGSL